MTDISAIGPKELNWYRSIVLAGVLDIGFRVGRSSVA